LSQENNISEDQPTGHYPASHSQMPIRVPFRSKRRNVLVKGTMASQEDSFQPSSSRLEEILSSADRVQELSDTSDSDYEDTGIVLDQHETANIAYVNRMAPVIRDDLVTDTSKLEDETLDAVLPFLEGNPNEFPLNVFGLPKLQRKKHIAFLEEGLGKYPSAYTAYDPARPWLVYWSLQGLTALGHDISGYRER
jgi:protein farnesyltransferase subunit beta